MKPDVCLCGSGTTDGLFCINIFFIVTLKKEQRLLQFGEGEMCGRDATFVIVCLI